MALATTRDQLTRTESNSGRPCRTASGVSSVIRPAPSLITRPAKNRRTLGSGVRRSTLRPAVSLGLRIAMVIAVLPIGFPRVSLGPCRLGKARDELLASAADRCGGASLQPLANGAHPFGDLGLLCPRRHRPGHDERLPGRVAVAQCGEGFGRTQHAVEGTLRAGTEERAEVGAAGLGPHGVALARQL